MSWDCEQVLIAESGKSEDRFAHTGRRLAIRFNTFAPLDFATGLADAASWHATIAQERELMSESGGTLGLIVIEFEAIDEATIEQIGSTVRAAVGPADFAARTSPQSISISMPDITLFNLNQVCLQWEKHLKVVVPSARVNWTWERCLGTNVVTPQSRAA